jgi:transposase-like protein
MLVPRQQYSRELKIAAMREIDSGKGIAEVARMYQLSPKRLETWKASGERKASWHFQARVHARKADSMPSGSLSWNARSDSRRWNSIF